MSRAWAAYDSVPRRRARALLRLARPVVTPAFYPRAGVTPAYWWDGHQNFGDALTPWLLHHYGRIAVHTAPGEAKMAGVGSILEQLPPKFSGTVWGSGLLYGEKVELPRATLRRRAGPSDEGRPGHPRPHCARRPRTADRPPHVRDPCVGGRSGWCHMECTMAIPTW